MVIVLSVVARVRQILQCLPSVHMECRSMPIQGLVATDEHHGLATYTV